MEKRGQRLDGESTRLGGGVTGAAPLGGGARDTAELRCLSGWPATRRGREREERGERRRSGEEGGA